MSPPATHRSPTRRPIDGHGASVHSRSFLFHFLHLRYPFFLSSFLIRSSHKTMPDQTLTDCIEHSDDRVMLFYVFSFDSCHAITTLDANMDGRKRSAGGHSSRIDECGLCRYTSIRLMITLYVYIVYSNIYLIYMYACPLCAFIAACELRTISTIFHQLFSNTPRQLLNPLKRILPGSLPNSANKRNTIISLIMSKRQPMLPTLPLPRPTQFTSIRLRRVE